MATIKEFHAGTGRRLRLMARAVVCLFLCVATRLVNAAEFELVDKLVVDGPSTFKSSATITYAGVNALGLSGAGAGLSFTGTGPNQILTASGVDLALMPGGTGNVGIGTTVPLATLEISVSDPILRLSDTSGASTHDWALAVSDQSDGDLAFKQSTTHGGLTYNTRMYITPAGNVGIGPTGPTAVLHLKAGTSSAGTAPLKFTSGTNLGTTEAGAIEYNGSHLYFTAVNAGTRYQLDQQAGTGANTALSNLASVAINTSLISDTNNADDLGSAAINWKNIHTRTVKYYGGTSGSVTLQATAVAGANTITIPAATGTMALTSDIHSPLTVAAIGAAPNANGMTLSTQQLNLQPANASYGGVVTTGAQTFAGAKTFNAAVTAGSFSGPGTGLTGTAASLTAGTATTAYYAP